MPVLPVRVENVSPSIKRGQCTIKQIRYLFVINESCGGVNFRGKLMHTHVVFPVRADFFCFGRRHVATRRHLQNASPESVAIGQSCLCSGRVSEGFESLAILEEASQ